MKVEITKILTMGAGEDTLCFVMVSKTEAIALIQSLANQLLNESPNVGRLESRCKGDAQEFTIAVMP